MVAAWIAVAGTYAVLFAAGFGVEMWTVAHRPERERNFAAVYLWLPLGGALTVALLLHSALTGPS